MSDYSISGLNTSTTVTAGNKQMVILTIERDKRGWFIVSDHLGGYGYGPALEDAVKDWAEAMRATVETLAGQPMVQWLKRVYDDYRQILGTDA